MYIVLTFTTRRYSEPDMRVFKSTALNHFKNTRKNVMVSYIIRVVSRANYFWKTGGCPKSEAPK